MYQLAFAPIEDSDQTAPPQPSMGALWVAKGQAFRSWEYTIDYRADQGLHFNVKNTIYGSGSARDFDSYMYQISEQQRLAYTNPYRC